MLIRYKTYIFILTFAVWNDCMVAEGMVVVETVKPYGSCIEMW